MRFSFDYRVQREADAALVATGRTVHACVDAQSLRPDTHADVAAPTICICCSAGA